MRMGKAGGWDSAGWDDSGPADRMEVVLGGLEGWDGDSTGAQGGNVGHVGVGWGGSGDLWGDGMA